MIRQSAHASSRNRKNRPLLERQARRRAARRKFLNRLTAWLVIGGALLALLAAQAALAASGLKKNLGQARQDLGRQISAYSSDLYKLDLTQADQANRFMSGLTQLSAAAGRASTVCQNQSGPWVGTLAKNYASEMEACKAFAGSAADLKASLDRFAQLSDYQIKLLAAIAPAWQYQSGPDRLDPAKGAAAWKACQSALQVIKPPDTTTQAVHQSMIEAARLISQTLERLSSVASAADRTQLINSLDNNYAILNRAGGSLKAELVKSQATLSASLSQGASSTPAQTQRFPKV